MFDLLDQPTALCHLWDDRADLLITNCNFNVDDSDGQATWSEIGKLVRAKYLAPGESGRYISDCEFRVVGVKGNYRLEWPSGVSDDNR